MEFRYEKENCRVIAVDENGKTAGECTYTSYDSYWSIDHTFVKPEYRGQNIAAGLLEAVVNEARKAGVKLMPVCSYAEKQFEKVDAYKELLYSGPAEKPAAQCPIGMN
jgi:hypothetical protein